jgi:ankyrin repeat protein
MPKKLFSTMLVIVISIFSVSCAGVSFHGGPIYYPPFIQAVHDGNIEEAEKLLKAGELVRQTTIGNQTALHVAAAQGHDKMVEWLLARDVGATAKDLNGETAADFATRRGHTQTAKIILDNIQMVKDENQAFASGDIELLRTLLSQDGREYTVLHFAAQFGEIQIIKDEIEAGANLNSQTLLGFTPLHKALISEKFEACQLIVDAGADIDIADVYNNTPLYYAVFFENQDLINLFLEAGADPNVRSVWGNETILDLAKRKDNAEIIALLEKICSVSVISR